MHVFGLREEAQVLLNIQEFEMICAHCCRHVSGLLLSVATVCSVLVVSVVVFCCTLHHH